MQVNIKNIRFYLRLTGTVLLVIYFISKLVPNIDETLKHWILYTSIFCFLTILLVQVLSYLLKEYYKK